MKGTPGTWWAYPGAEGSVAGTTEAIPCPKCGEAPVVYNGNYFCGYWGDGCDWALPHPARLPRDRVFCDLIGTDYY